MLTPRLLLLLAGAVVFGLSACKRPVEAPAENRVDPLPVRTATAQLGTVARTQETAGTLRPFAHAMVASRIMARVARADFVIGQQVAAGEALITLDAEETTARLAQAEAAFDQAKRDHERESGLLAKGVATSESVRALADRLRIAEAARSEARTLRDYTTVTAPFAGFVTRKFVNSGDLAAPGTPLFAIEGAGDLRAEVEVPASLPILSAGATLRVRPPSGEITGTLVELSPAADPQTRTRLAKISLPDGSGAHSGDFVRVDWPAGEITALTVPADAVTVMGQMERVFVVHDDRARLRLVKTAGLTGDGFVRIAAGLDAGETVVLAPPASLRDGQPVEIVP